MSPPDERYRLLVERSPYCIHEIDLEGCFLSMNAAGLAMMGVDTEAEIVGSRYLDVVGEGDLVRITELLISAFEGASSRFEFTSTNAHVFTSSFVPILDTDGNLVRLMGLTQDVTEQ